MELLNAFGEIPGDYPIEVFGPTPGDQFGIFGDNSKLKSLGWNPEVTLSLGLQRLGSWAKPDRT